MTTISDDDTATLRRPRPVAPVADPAQPDPGARIGLVAVWAGRLLAIVGLGAWLGWLSWRMTGLTFEVACLAVLVLEFVAFAAALVVTAGLWASRPVRRRDRRSTDRNRPLPILLAEALDLGAVVDESVVTGLGSDDTGEIAWARRGIRVLGQQRRGTLRDGLNVREAAWSVVAVDGLRRLFSVAVLMIVLFTGTAAIPVAPVHTALLLFGGVGVLSLGHWLMSGGHVRPGSRTIWSMRSIGAGLGDGVSRSGLPIRWAVTMATVVALNISVALRGISDRWTHGLGPMDRDVRIVAMSCALLLVGAGGVALRKMQRPELGFYGATRRLEEPSVRHLALGLTLLVAIVGFVAGAVPDVATVAAR